MKAQLVFEDGTVFEGTTFTNSGEITGEVVFNTALTGYQEVITDPSYSGQIVVMTYPIIGSYGINKEDVESRSLFLKALIVREYIDFPSNWRSEKTLKEYSLSIPYDVTTATEIQSTSLGSTLVIDESYSDDTNKDPPQGLEFSKDGSMLFILIINNSDEIFKSGDFMEDEIFQFKLTTPFDTSTMSLVGSSNVTSGYPQPPTVSVNSGDYSTGFTISPNGDRLFIINHQVGAGDIGNDSISQVKLSCFFICRKGF